MILLHHARWGSVEMLPQPFAHVRLRSDLTGRSPFTHPIGADVVEAPTEVAFSHLVILSCPRQSNQRDLGGLPRLPCESPTPARAIPQLAMVTVED